MTLIPQNTQEGRLYLIENGASPGNGVQYVDTGWVDSITQPVGTIDPVNVSSSSRAGEYEEIGTTKGPPERTTTNFTAKFSRDQKSLFLELTKKGCPFDALIIGGACRDLANHNEYDNVFYLPNANSTGWNSTPFGAFDSSTTIDETINISSKAGFQLFQLSYASRGSSVLTVEVIDVVVSDTASCGDCDTVSDGCQKIFAVTLAAGGSPGTPADVVFSLDKGAIYQAHDIDSLTVGSNPTAIAIVGSYIVVTSNDDASLETALKSEFDGTTDPTFTTVTTGIVAGGEPNDIWSVGSFAIVVGDGGYVYKTTDPTSGVTVIDAGIAVQDDLNAVHGISKDFFIAVGNAGSIVKTDGQTAQSITGPVGVGVNFNTVWVKTEKLWFIGGDDGLLHYTKDGGETWLQRAFSGSGSGIIRDIAFSNNNVGYMSHDTIAPLGRIFETIDGGDTWIVAPRAVGTLPVNDRITALAVCTEDVNFVVGVGLADDAVDGFIIVGED